MRESDVRQDANIKERSDSSKNDKGKISGDVTMLTWGEEREWHGDCPVGMAFE